MAAALRLRLRSAVCSIVVYLLVSLIVCKLAECPQKRSRDEGQLNCTIKVILLNHKFSRSQHGLYV